MIFVVCWTLTTHGKYSVSGDEPHYLMVSQSLWADGDLDLRNNYQDDDGKRFGAAGLETGLHALENPAGKLFPAHDVGVPIVLTPLYGLATAISSVSSEAILARFRMTRGLFVYSLISLCMIGLVAWAAAITRRVLITQGTTSALASIVVLVAWLSPPVLSNSFLIFPEPFALFVTAVCLHIAFADDLAPTRRTTLLLAAMLGVLPWFHRKYAIYAAALLVAVVWQRRSRVASLPSRDRLLALAVYLVPQIGLAVWTGYYWGNIGGPLTMMELPPFSWNAFRSGSLGLFVDRENGLFVWAPVFALVPAAWAMAGPRYVPWLLPAASLLLMSAAHERWWGGFSPAGRFLVPLIPIVLCAGIAALRQRMFRHACLALLIPQLFIAADGWQHTRSLWPQGNGHNRILSDLLAWIGGSETLLPSLRTSPHAMNRATLEIGALAVVNVLVWAATKWTSQNQERPDEVARTMRRALRSRPTQGR